ncbi:hypothetical protein PF005_g13436 [Phytophthora fragariae]|uniref:Pectate lyase n=1 Tax=Phytophthora fragariae TaxID=53985 RepID=A0A6A3XMT2_9STRA|nr:hypothetical protein PF003_g12879 [Phytophthora fragariae]KAE8935310.1 hypothetical protein PF009_g14745 [Phytophthora fragariae]KAE9006104.1 hypothetical protein PF011_g11754 [Phytophthora fragariae]KAE9105099.1 hypothetical protein PF010_g13152 [Phytophthora fragariae]KAE9105118.1 hypothetical protein PF007_g13821 [Phytophthora fragariae]
MFRHVALLSAVLLATALPVATNTSLVTAVPSRHSYTLELAHRNFANGVASMKVGKQDVDSCTYFLLDGSLNDDTSAADIEPTSVSGEVITKTLSLTADECSACTPNFGGSITQHSSTSQTSQSSTTKEQSD